MKKMLILAGLILAVSISGYAADRYPGLNTEVAGVDATGNTYTRDVIGNKTDAAVQAKSDTASLAAYAKGFEDGMWGTAGIAAWPNAVAPANGVSIAEGIRYIAESVTAVSLGAMDVTKYQGDSTTDKTGMAYIKGLNDAMLGTAGITTWPNPVAAGNGVNLFEAVRYISENMALVGSAMTLGASAVTAAAVATDAIGAAEIADNAIDNAALAAGAIGASEIDTDAIGAAELAADCLTTAELATGCVSSDEVAADAIGASEIAADAVGASEIATDAVGAAEIAADAITNAEIANDAIGATEIANDAIDATAIATGAVDADAIAADAVTTAELATGCISADEVADSSVDAGALATDSITSDEIAATAVTELQAGLSTAAVVGALADAGVQAVAADKTVMQYSKGTLDILAGTTGITAFPNAAAAANDVSIAEVLRYVSEQQAYRIVKKTADPTGATDNLFTVTGLVEMMVVGVVTTETTRAGGAVTLKVGTTTDEDGCGISLTDARQAVGTLITTTDAEQDIGSAPTTWKWANATTIVLTLGNACDAGVIDFYCIYKPISATGAVAAAA